MADETKELLVEVPEQGLDLVLDRHSGVVWIDAEIAFLNEMSALMNEQVNWNQRGFNNSQMHQNALRTLQQVRRALHDNNDWKPLAQHIEDARNLSVVIGAGSIGARAKVLVKRGDKEEARWLLLIYGSKWVDGNLAVTLAPWRAAVLGHPSFAAGADLLSAETAKETAAKARAESQQAASAMAKVLNEKTDLFVKLEDLYREKLATEEPAVFWERVAARKRIAWATWLLIFGALVFFPLIMAAVTWDALMTGLGHITINSGSSIISISALAVVTLPALLYGWLLKNVGRVFLQSLMLADDANHRHALAMTYLGLVANPKHGLEREDRAIILNALFRPIPPHSGEDGPPAGLVELVRGKN